MFGLATAARRPPAPVPDPPPDPPPSQVDIGEVWGGWGDSHMAGRANGSTLGPFEAFCNIWENTPALAALGPAAPYTGLASNNPYKNGEGGRSLAGSRTAYDARTTGAVNKSNLTLLWFQESGNQSSPDGQQDTVPEYKAGVKSWCIAADTNSPGVIIVKENAFSFGREGEPGRNWDDYNDADDEAVAELESEEGIIVYLVDTDALVKALQAAIGAANVWFQSNESNAYHYKDPGNLLIALGVYHALGYDVTALNLSGIDQVSADHKTACINAVTGA